MIDFSKAFDVKIPNKRKWPHFELFAVEFAQTVLPLQSYHIYATKPQKKNGNYIKIYSRISYTDFCPKLKQI